MTLRNRRVLSAAIVTLAVAAAPAHADSLDKLADALARFRGVGYSDVASYRVTLRLPDESDEDTVPLHEYWRAPADLVLRPADPRTHRAVVRGLALYLEPLYIARASLLGSDFVAGAESVREGGHVEETRVADGDSAGVRIAVEFPADPGGLPDAVSDLESLAAVLDDEGRIRSLSLRTRDGDGAALRCSYADGLPAPQPAYVRWDLPQDEHVEIETEFRAEGGRYLPARRTVKLPDPYDPRETMVIVAEYEEWLLHFDPRDPAFDAADSFRYDANGLVTE